MDEKALATFAVEMAPRVIGEALLALLTAGQEMTLVTLQAHLRREQERRGPGNFGHPVYEAALTMLAEAAQRDA